MTTVTQLLPEYQGTSATVLDLVNRLSFAEKALTSALGSGMDAVCDGSGHSYLLRQAQIALQQSEQRFRTLIEKSSDVIALVAADGTVLYDSPAVERTLGYAPAELVGQSIFRLFHPEDLARAKAVLTRLCATPRACVTEVLRFRHKDGRYRWLEGTGTNLLDQPGVNAVVINYRDITDRREAEAALRANATFTEDVLNSLAAHVAVLDETGTIIAVNEAWRRFARENGAGANDFIGVNYLAVCRERGASADATGAAEAGAGIGAVLAGERTNFTMEYPCHAPAGARWFRLRVSPLGGGRRGVVVSHHDISEQRRNMEALHASEQRFKALFEQAAVGVAQTDARTGQFVQVNRRLCEILEYREEALRGLSFAAVTHPQDIEGSMDAMRRLRAGSIREGTWEKRYIRRSGAAVWVSLTVSAMWAPGAQPDYFIAIVQDITERKQLEEQFRQAQKMDAIGQLSGGVAHDFNNMLAVIKGHIGIMELTGQITPEISESVQEISTAADRASNLTRQLLLFSRQQTMQPRHLDLGAAAREMSKMLRRVVGEQVEVEVRATAGPLAVRADPGMIDQVLLNLAVNARDAMPGGGRLVITAERIDVTAEILRRRPDVAPGAYICLSVTDTGTGIDPQILPKIFEPFFTTKEVGKGTGLGLATVYGIVRQHEGWIDVQSEVGAGTTFAVYLPCTPDPVAAVQAFGEGPAFSGGTETILLVEDEPAVRFMIQTVLRQRGYRVYAAENGVAACALWRERSAEFDLLLTDVVMPDKITGKELAERLVREKPALRVIFISGYNQEFTGSSLLREGENYLAKPFGADELLRALRANLDTPAAAHTPPSAAPLPL